jgi:hypothetical protein
MVAQNFTKEVFSFRNGSLFISRSLFFVPEIFFVPEKVGVLIAIFGLRRAAGQGETLSKQNSPELSTHAPCARSALCAPNREREKKRGRLLDSEGPRSRAREQERER